MFDYIFLAKDFPADVQPPVRSDLLHSMRTEFEYWYPFDLRVSAKDLIPNHLTMSLYNHVEIWKDRPQMWPKSKTDKWWNVVYCIVAHSSTYCSLSWYAHAGIYCNGHIMVDAEKMSKGKGEAEIVLLVVVL